MNIAEFKHRAIQALEECGLSAQQAAGCADNIPQFSPLIKKIHNDSDFWQFNTKVTKTAELLGIDKGTFIKAAIKQPQLFYQTPETINDNIERAAELLSLEKSTFIKAALRQPQLFYQKPETINKNIERAAELLSLEKSTFIKAALRQPSLFHRKPITTNRSIERTATLLNIDKHSFIRVAMKQPSLFYQKPKTIIENIDKTIELLGVNKDSFIKAAIKQPQLLGRKPETINKNTEGMAELLDLDKSTFIKIALKQPALFCQKPETISEHVRLMQVFNKRGIIIPNVQDAYLKNPALLCLSNDNFKLRLTFAAHAGLSGQSNFMLLYKTRKDVEAEMVSFLGHNPKEKTIRVEPQSNSRALLAEMIADKRIKGYQLSVDTAGSM